MARPDVVRARMRVERIDDPVREVDPTETLRTSANVSNGGEEPSSGDEVGSSDVRDGDTAFVARLLAGTSAGDPSGGVTESADIRAWSGDSGVLADGRPARAGVSCLIRPVPGDRVVIWSSAQEGCCWVLAILQRQDPSASTVIAMAGNLALETKRFTVAADSVNIAATDFLTSTRNRHIVEDTRTQTSRLRVSRIGTDIRQVTTSDDTVHGTFLQRAGTWLSTTAREARLTARSFLFN